MWRGFFIFTVMFNAITDVAGIKVGHYTDLVAATGCTVVLCEKGATAGVEVRGGAPGARETDPLGLLSLNQIAHAILLTGGSAFGLEAAYGVMRYLEEGGHGVDMGVARVPIVPGAVIFDLGIGDPGVRPGAEQGYKACLSATSGEVVEGSVGAGTGAIVGKALGREKGVKGGVGAASEKVVGEVVVGVIVAVNAFGEVINPGNGEIIAGPRYEGRFISTLEVLRRFSDKVKPHPSNTTIGVVATNAHLNRREVVKLSQMAQDGIARAIHPSHMMVDGDVVFSLSCGEEEADINLLGGIACELMSRAILRAVDKAEGICGIPSVKDVRDGA
jgi:L-aminopeptidase/D-esterase-like protein